MGESIEPTLTVKNGEARNCHGWKYGRERGQI